MIDDIWFLTRGVEKYFRVDLWLLLPLLIKDQKKSISVSDTTIE